MRKALLALLILCMARMAQAQSYEGYMGRGPWPIWIWMDLGSQGGDSSLAGTYFYKKHGGEIALAGKISGKILRIVELDRKKNETASFALRISGDTLSGTWTKTGGQDSLPVRLYKTDPAYRKTAKIPKVERLILADGSALANELEWSEEESPEKRHRFEYGFNFARKNILGVTYYYSGWGAYPVEGAAYHTFNLVTRREIEIRKEIDPGKFPAFNAYFAEMMLPRMPGCREDRSDSDWDTAFGDWISDEKSKLGLKRAIDKMFTVPKLPGNEDYLLVGDSLEAEILHYFGFPHVIEAMDCTFDMKMPLSELGGYLKRGSPLQPITAP